VKTEKNLFLKSLNETKSHTICNIYCVAIKKASANAEAFLNGGEAGIFTSPNPSCRSTRKQSTHSLRRNPYVFPLIFPFLPQEVQVRR